VTEAATESAISSWFDDGPEPTLLGLQCTTCGNKVFPPRAILCPNPACSGTDFQSVPLGRFGKLWSFTDAQYAPPPPYPAATGEYEAFALVAVELDEEKMIVLGQAVPEVNLADLSVGMPMELTTGTLADGTVVWKWKPAGDQS